MFVKSTQNFLETFEKKFHLINEDLADDIRKNLNLDESSFLSDLSIDDIIRETIKETLNEWFANNLKPIVEESVKEEVAKLFKKRN